MERPCTSKNSENGAGYSRRRVLDMMAAGGLAAMMAGFPSRVAQSSEDEVVRMGYLPIVDATPLLVAHALGYFEEEGLQVEKPRRIKGWSTLTRGFAGGHFNLVHLLKPIPVWMRYNNHFPVKIMAWAHTNGSAILVGEKTGIEDFKDLGGRKIAVPYWYSMHNIILQEGLRQAGIRPVVDTGEPISSDSCGLQVIPPSLMVKSLAVGSIDGFSVAEPFNAMGELASGKIMRFTGDIWKNHPCCVICMHESDTIQKPEWTQKILNAIVRAELYTAKNKQKVAYMLSRDGKGYLPASAMVLERAMTFYEESAYSSPKAIRHKSEWHNGRVDFSPYPYPSATQLIVEMMNKTVVGKHEHFLSGVKPDFVVKDLVNYECVKHSLENYPEWKILLDVDPNQPYQRKEILSV